jgi:hypothetical protein
MGVTHLAWELSRSRFIDTIRDLSDTQLRWRLHKDSLTIGEAALHVAGVEVSFSTQLLGIQPEGELLRLKLAATDGVVNDQPFPFAEDEITADRIARALEQSKELVWPIVHEPSPEILKAEIVSALGPVIDGQGALSRLSFHAAYHQGQAYMMRTAPGFPTA